MRELISVIIPAYNVEAWLSRCLDSVLTQTYKNLQVIVINDGSTDSTGQIIENYAKQDVRIVPVHQENIGLVKTRERGIELAEGEFVTFVDGDDAIVCDMYERLLKNAVTYQADISHCGMSFCFPDGHEELHYGTGKIVVQDHHEGLKDLLEGKYIEPSLCNKLYRKDLLKNSCLDFNILNNEDLLRNFVLFERAQKSVYEDYCGYIYYQRIGSMSKDEKRVVESSKQVEYARRIIVQHVSEDIYPYAMQTWLSSIVNTINTLTYNEDAQIKEYCEECRKILRMEKKNLHYLVKSQQVAARMILISPKLHRFIYFIYKATKGRE